YAIRLRVPLVQLPGDTAWGWDAKAPFALAESWLGTALSDDDSPAALVRRYLAAFGPATPTDAACWLGLRGLRATFDALRPELMTFRDERGRELFDLPDAPRPDGDVDAPVRFLPEFDNLVLGHDDRTRVVAPEHRPYLFTRNLLVPATFLVDGVVAGTWTSTCKRGVATLTLTPFGKLTKPVQRELRDEGLALLRFVEEGAKDHVIAFDAPAA
ncbi:MAG TPA: winged helix DNA-binding domain-containing protein, partial [Gemmatimonadaceae bacterium]|nr:winged helix DNA-binding domain-containing protein [Gemmatimonadaceae bacterium]